MEKINVAENLAISETGFLYLPSSGETFTSNEIGKNIIRLLQKGEDKKNIVEQVTNEYDVDKNTFEKDLDDFISQLHQFKLIEES